MTIAPTLQTYLDRNVTYDLILHEPAMTSMRTAEACHIPGDCLAKGIVLRRNGGYALAVLPASHHIHLPDLRTPNLVTISASPAKTRSHSCS